jgi:hypothetical protein
MASAPGPEGELVAANDQRVLRFRANGRPRKYFGGNGRAKIPTPEGMSFRLAGVAVDSHGRPLLTGFAALTPSVCNTTPVYLNTTIVARLTAGGNPDPSFGSGGNLVHRFPVIPSESFDLIEVPSLAVDRQNRVVVLLRGPTPRAATSTSRSAACCPTAAPTPTSASTTAKPAWSRLRAWRAAASTRSRPTSATASSSPAPRRWGAKAAASWPCG